MAIPTVNQVATQLMVEFGEDTSNSNIVSKFEAWIQDIFDEIGVQTEWQYRYLIEAKNTVAGTRLYTFSGLQDQILSAQFVDNLVPVTYKSKLELQQMGLDLNLTGRPRYMYIEKYDDTTEQYTIGLQPIPNAVYSINFLGLLQPQQLSSTTKLPFSRKFLFLLKDGIRFRLKIADKDFNAAQLFRSNFKDNLEVMKKQDTVNKNQYRRMQVQDISSGRDDLVQLPPDHFRN